MAGFGAGPTVTLNKVKQRWPWEQKVDISFTVEAEAGKTADVEIRFFDGGKRLEVPDEAASMIPENLAAGEYVLTIDPGKTDWRESWIEEFRVELRAAESPLYMVVDLTKARGEAGQVEYITESELRSGARGTYEVNPVAGVESVIWTGVTNDVAYATQKMVFRKVEPGTFDMGMDDDGNQKDTMKWFERHVAGVRLTKPFWAGVFEVTQYQWRLLMGAGLDLSKCKKNGDTRPAEMVSFLDVRGGDWPKDGYGKAAAGTFMQKLSALLGMAADLPTYAQWSCLHMAGTRSYFNNGADRSTFPHRYADGLIEYAWGFGRFASNQPATPAVPSGIAPASEFAEVDTDQATARVGSYRPNAWGIYDTHGNVWEFVLDRRVADGVDKVATYAADATDPTGPAEGAATDARVRMGGSWRYGLQYMRTGFSGYDVQMGSHTGSRNDHSGFRAIVMHRIKVQ